MAGHVDSLAGFPPLAGACQLACLCVTSTISEILDVKQKSSVVAKVEASILGQRICGSEVQEGKLYY